MILEDKWMAKLGTGVSRKTVSGTLSYRCLFPAKPLTTLLRKDMGHFGH